MTNPIARKLRSNERSAAAAPALALLLACVLGSLQPAGAESAFAREGIGQWNEGYDLRGYTLGSTGIGTVDANNFTSVNPAATAFSSGTLGHGGFASVVRWTDDGSQTARRSGTTVSELGVVTGLFENLFLRLMLVPATDATYSFEQSVPTGFEDIERDVVREEGMRGLNRYLAGLSWRGGSNWAIGAQLGLFAGSIAEETSFVFGDSARAAGWTPGEDRRQWRFKVAPSFDVGFLARPVRPISFGGFFSSGASPEVTETYRSFAGESYTLQTTDAELPSAYGAGAAWRFSSRWRASADVVHRLWEDFRFDDRLPPGGAYRNTSRWGAGLEYVPSERSTGLLQSIAWRAGFAWIPWYFNDAQGDAIDEWRVTAGAGLPIQKDRGTIDVVIGYGKRGAIEQVGLEEQFLSLGLGFTFARVQREY